MKTLSIIFLAVLLLALHLTSQMAQASDSPPSHPKSNSTATGNGCGSSAAFALLFAPLMLSTVLLHGWSG